jgi:hypothetical protein
VTISLFSGFNGATLHLDAPNDADVIGAFLLTQSVTTSKRC